MYAHLATLKCQHTLAKPNLATMAGGPGSIPYAVPLDERGCGLSDWDAADLSFEAWVQDLETVIEATGLERFPLLGMSQGGPIAVAYAADYPERVSHLILYGT